MEVPWTDERHAVVPSRVPSVGLSREAFAELYRAHFAYVYRSARHLGVGMAEVDDVVQETFLTAYRLVDRYQSQNALRGWLFSILFRVVQRHRRWHARRGTEASETSAIEQAVSTEGGPERSVEAAQSIRMLEAILDELPDEQRAVLVLAELEEKTLAEIASILGINVNTASSRLHRAREHVEASFARREARDGWRFT